MGTLALPKRPIPNMVVQTIILETRKAPAAAKTGRVRAASHNKIGNGQPTGSSTSQAFRGSKTMIEVTIASDRSPKVPSTYSLRDGGWRRAPKSPITKGATVTMPKTSPANQRCQVGSIIIDGSSNKLFTTATPSDGAAAATTAAPSRPNTFRARSSAK